MTVLKNPGSPANLEVAAVDASESAREERVQAKARRLRLGTPQCLGVAVVLLLLAVGLSNGGAPAALSSTVMTAAVVTFLFTVLVAAARALIGFVEILRGEFDRDDRSLASAVLATLGNAALVGFGMFLAYLGTVGFSRGRQLRRRGRVLLPGLRDGGEWADPPMHLAVERVPDGLADQWRENGKTEHASVAAFARLTLDLMALGGPPRLVAAANEDALDEIRHARLCFSLATALDGKRVSPAPFPVAQRVSPLPRARTLALAQLAVSSLVDGALHEGVSARIIARLARTCEAPAIREMLKSIAADEGRHAAHGWTVVEWCVEKGGAPVRAALLGALRALPREMHTQLPGPAADGGWERWGIHGHALENEEYAKALALVRERVHTIITPSVRAA